MLWFKKRKRLEVAQAKHEAQVEVEVKAHRQQQRKAVADAKEATDKFVKQFRDNGFTLKIYKAVGGRS